MSEALTYYNPGIVERIKEEEGLPKNRALSLAELRNLNEIIRKPWKTCTWYPDQCAAITCRDYKQGPCEIYKDDSLVWDDVLL